MGDVAKLPHDGAFSEEDLKLDELARQWGELKVYRTRMGAVAFRPPKMEEIQRFTDKVGEDRKSKFSAMKELVYACRVYPEREGFIPIVQSLPGLVLKACDEVCELAGTDLEAEVKKA